MNIMMGSLLLIFACAPALSTGIKFAGPTDLLGIPDVDRVYRSNYSRWDGQWNGPVVRSGGRNFSILPDYRFLAEQQGWILLDHCDRSLQFPGLRYKKNGDNSLILMYNIARYLAGVQCVIPKAGLPANYPPRSQIGNIFQEDGDRYVITVYFTHPREICRYSVNPLYALPRDDLGFYIQTGSNPQMQHIFIPYRRRALEHSLWKKKRMCGSDFVTYHSYNMNTNMSCDDLLPVFLIYENYNLYGFGLALGVHQTSAHFEHPPTFRVSNAIKPKPDCWDASYPNQSTMHIFMTDQPRCFNVDG